MARVEKRSAKYIFPTDNPIRATSIRIGVKPATIQLLLVVWIFNTSGSIYFN